jgi:DNA mismatch repair protein MutS2
LKEEKESAHKSPFTIGQSVFHKKSNKRGVVVGIAEGSPKAQILTGNVKLSVDSSELILESEVPPQQKEDKEAGKRWSVSSLPSDKKQLSLVGCTVSEALPLVDRMIDQALVHGYTRLKIVHGVGSGTLKRAIREHLKKNFYVRGLSQGGGDGSSDGITIVEL